MVFPEPFKLTWPLTADELLTKPAPLEYGFLSEDWPIAAETAFEAPPEPVISPQFPAEAVDPKAFPLSPSKLHF